MNRLLISVFILCVFSEFIGCDLSDKEEDESDIDCVVKAEKFMKCCKFHCDYCSKSNELDGNYRTTAVDKHCVTCSQTMNCYVRTGMALHDLKYFSTDDEMESGKERLCAFLEPCLALVSGKCQIK